MTCELIDELDKANRCPKNHIILLGDFNIHKPTNSVKLLTAAEFCSHIWQDTFQPKMLFSYFKIMNFINVSTLYNNTNTPNYTPDDRNKHSSTIDYIFSSNSCLHNIIGFHISKGLYSSDHKILSLTIINPTNFYRDKKAFNIAKWSRNKLSMRYNISALLPEQWVDFNNKLQNYLNIHSSLPSPDINAQTFVDTELQHLYTGITTTLEDINVKKLMMVLQHNNMPLHIGQDYNTIHHLSGIISIINDYISSIVSVDSNEPSITELHSAFFHYWKRSHK